MKKYLRIARPDHWIKQLFVFPGCLIALMLLDVSFPSVGTWKALLTGFISTCLIASANYVINEWLDAGFDKYHPTKKNRSVVTEDVKGSIVYMEYVLFTISGFVFGALCNKHVLLCEVLLWIMGILYNVPPIRTKDIAILDVLSESVNNAIRLLIGWFVMTESFLPPVSIVAAYWMGGAFLMATKRFAEYRMIGDPELAGRYRKSFAAYSEELLLTSAFFYALCSTFLMGIFLIKYKIEFILLMPFLFLLFVYYFHIAYKPDSAAQKPEKLFREKYLMLYVLFLMVLFYVLLHVNIPQLSVFTQLDLIAL